jgi:predicted component of type VI protein secretion system
LDRDEWVLGTGVSCQVVLEDPLIQDRHARIRRSGVGFTIEPMGEDSIIRVNGQDDSGLTPLEDEDEILLGRTRIRWGSGELMEGMGEDLSLDDSISSFSAVPRPSGMFSAISMMDEELTTDSGAVQQTGVEEVVSGDHLMDSMNQVVAALRSGLAVPEVALASLAGAFGADRALLFLPLEGTLQLVASFMAPAELAAEDGLDEALLADACVRRVPISVDMEAQGLARDEERSLMATTLDVYEGVGRLVVDAPLSRRLFVQQDYGVLAAFGRNLAHLLTSNSQLRSMERRLRRWSLVQARQCCGGGENPTLEEALRSVAVSSKPVLILGEAGVGKGQAAQALHQFSPRAQEPCLVVNCAAQHDVARAIFGFADLEKGVEETGALGLARRGTLVLTHVTALPMAVQSRLERFLATGEYRCEGEDLRREGDVRLVLTSLLDPGRSGGGGWFLDDFYRRFRRSRILRIPSFREDPERLERVARHLLVQLSRQRKRAVLDLESDGWEVLLEASWPGNLPELQMVLAEAVEGSSGDKVTAETLRGLLDG